MHSTRREMRLIKLTVILLLLPLTITISKETGRYLTEKGGVFRRKFNPNGRYYKYLTKIPRIVELTKLHCTFLALPKSRLFLLADSNRRDNHQYGQTLHYGQLLKRRLTLKREQHGSGEFRFFEYPKHEPFNPSTLTYNTLNYLNPPTQRGYSTMANRVDLASLTWT
ncbi:hypothetical protein GGR53DRAFT_84809 [Hypoxylon sp. FL1150]|nr:hypothetical protein GGR53DRAFT_84809 [Hypoxylon sp. FL1150]